MKTLSNGAKINKLVFIQYEYDLLVSKYEHLININLDWLEVNTKSYKKEKAMSKRITELHSNYVAIYKQINFNA